MKISSAEYATSIAGENSIMSDKSMHVAFLGRSNVGKSSLINLLVEQKNLAKSSTTPGKTKRIYFYLINQGFYFVDLPGYGYAQVSRSRKDLIKRMIEWYVTHEEFGVRKYVLIIDFKVGPTQDDLDYYQLLKDQDKEVIIVANKLDKIKKTHRPKQTQKIIQALSETEIIFFSAKTKQGKEQLIDRIFG